MMKLGHDIYLRIDVVFFFSPFEPIPDTLSLIFPISAAAALSLGVGTVLYTGAQALRFMTALASMSHWVSQAMSRRLALLFPPFP
jgi:hypothetical protein